MKRKAVKKNISGFLPFPLNILRQTGNTIGDKILTQMGIGVYPSGIPAMGRGVYASGLPATGGFIRPFPTLQGPFHPILDNRIMYTTRGKGKSNKKKINVK